MKVIIYTHNFDRMFENVKNLEITKALMSFKNNEWKLARGGEIKFSYKHENNDYMAATFNLDKIMGYAIEEVEE